MINVNVGEIVDVRNYGRAEVIEPLVSEPGSRFYGRIRVKYQCDGKTYYARPENLRKTVQVQQRVLLCHSTTHYRTCAASVVNWNDAVLEVGSHEGECTWLLSRRCRYIVGVDKSQATVAAARRRYPGLRFEEVDGFDVPALKALGPPDGSGFSVVLVDIGGIASLSTVAALVGLYYKEFPYNTKIVVKSVFLKRLVEDTLPYNTEKHNPWALLPSAAATVGRGDVSGTPGVSYCDNRTEALRGLEVYVDGNPDGASRPLAGNTDGEAVDDASLAAEAPVSRLVGRRQRLRRQHGGSRDGEAIGAPGRGMGQGREASGEAPSAAEEGEGGVGVEAAAGGLRVLEL